ncbi:MAG TPA: hypothetical protein IAD27_06350 [Candidatus Merdousia gallistercoris]|nr:hypothetical protein [Candidatus Merdousia gallistercoris]
MKSANLTYTMAFWLLRFWLAARAIGTGLTKFIGKVEGEIPNPEFEAKIKETMADGLTRSEAMEIVTDVPEKISGTMDVISFSSYHGLPEKGPMTIETFSASPLMPSFMVEPYAAVLGYALVALGITVLLGICTRVSLFLMGLLYISLTWGFIILEPNMGPSAAAGIAYLGVHMVLIVAALLLADYNKFELLPCKKFGFCKCSSKE